MADKNKNQGGEGMDFANYKGIYFEDDGGQKYTCPVTGAHFEYYDMFRRLNKVARQRQKLESAERQTSAAM